MTSVHKVAVALSGGGRSLINLLEHQRQESCAYQVVGVIASRPDCRGVEIARTHKIALFIDNFGKQTPPDLVPRLSLWLLTLQIEWIALAGFLKPFPLLPSWKNRTVNIHPALLPHFGGAGMYGNRVHAAVLAAGVKETGATVHFVTDRYDEGDVIAQIVTPVKVGDTAESLAARVFSAECQLYPQVLNKLVVGAWPQPNGLVERFFYNADS